MYPLWWYAVYDPHCLSRSSGSILQDKEMDSCLFWKHRSEVKRNSRSYSNHFYGGNSCSFSHGKRFSFSLLARNASFGWHEELFLWRILSSTLLFIFLFVRNYSLIIITIMSSIIHEKPYKKSPAIISHRMGNLKKKTCWSRRSWPKKRIYVNLLNLFCSCEYFTLLFPIKILSWEFLTYQLSRWSVGVRIWCVLRLE